MRRAELLVHPRAGSGGAVAALRRWTASSAWPETLRSEIHEVASVDDAAERLGRMEEGTIPVSAGGDGTLNMVAQAIRAASLDVPKLGLLPLGTANLMARELGIRGMRSAIEGLAGDRVRPVDVMETDHPQAPLALVSFSGAFEADFIHRYAYRRRRGRGRAVGIAAGLAAVPGGGGSVALSLDGEEVTGPGEGAYSVGLYNTSRYPGGAIMIPGGNPSDGHADAVVYRTARAYWTAAARGLARSPAPTAPGLLRRPWTTARLVSDGPLQMDGEALGGGDVCLKVVAGALSVLVPGRG